MRIKTFMCIPFKLNFVLSLKISVPPYRLLRNTHFGVKIGVTPFSYPFSLTQSKDEPS